VKFNIVTFGALRALPKGPSDAQEASRGRLVVGNSQRGGNDDVQRNAHNAVSNEEKASRYELGGSWSLTQTETDGLKCTGGLFNRLADREYLYAICVRY
jgi:hypothetical protein